LGGQDIVGLIRLCDQVTFVQSGEQVVTARGGDDQRRARARVRAGSQGGRPRDDLPADPHGAGGEGRAGGLVVADGEAPGGGVPADVVGAADGEGAGGGRRGRRGDASPRPVQVRGGRGRPDVQDGAGGGTSPGVGQGVHVLHGAEYVEVVDQ